MKKRFLSRILLIAASLAIAGVLVASNMGHIAEISLTQPGTSPIDGTNTLNLPYDLGPNITNAKQLMDDIGFAKVTNVSRYLKASQSYQTYTGRKNGGLAFSITPGEGYLVKMTTTTNYTVVGSHDPSKILVLGQAGTSPDDGTNFVSLPFNIAAHNAKELMDDIGFANVVNVSRYVKATNAYQTYTGRKNGGLAFPIRHDEAYYIKMQTTVNYTPSHY